MPTEIKQKKKWCKGCQKKTLHQATIKTTDLGCGFILGNVFLSVITFGIWVPIFILFFGVSVFTNALAPAFPKWLCQVCGRRN